MKPDAYMKLYIGDWLQDTLYLDATTTGAYFLLILAHWGKPGIPATDQALRTVGRVAPQDWARVKGELLPFFAQIGGMWVNKRAITEYNDAANLYSERVARMEAARAVNPNVNPDNSPDDGQLSGQTSILQPQPQPQLQSEPKTKPPAAASPPERSLKRMFTDAWITAWERSHGKPYPEFKLNGAKEGKAADRLLKLGVSSKDLIRVAEQAWEYPDGFECKHAVTVAGFAARYTNIVAELENPARASAAPRKSSMSEPWVDRNE